MMRCIIRLGTVLFLALPMSHARADEFHYKSVLIGERAAGLGGAYVALSDDPSGVFYNPAGLIRAKEGHFSASANAYHSTTQTYRDFAPGQHYTIRSSGLVPSFTGFTRMIDDHRIGFLIAVPDSDLTEQNDDLKNLSSVAGAAGEFRRRLSRQNNLFVAGPAYAFPLPGGLSGGISLLSFSRVDRAVDAQLVLLNPIPTGKYVQQDTYLARNTYGINPKVGIQYPVSNEWMTGLTISYRLNLFGSGIQRRVTTKTDATGTPTALNGAFDNDLVVADTAVAYKDPQVVHFAWGNAYRLSDRFLVSADVELYTGDPGFTGFALRPTFNWSLGGEWNATETMILRGAIYSNNANTFHLDAAKQGQAPHVSLLSATAGASLMNERTSLTFGVAYSAGSGQGQVTAGSTAIQEMEQSSLTLYLCGSYQL